MARTISLLPAEASDAKRIAVLSRNLVEHHLPWTWTPGRVARCVADRETIVLSAKDHHTIAGFGIMQYGDHEAHLNLLAVTPEYRLQGVGAQLVRWLEESALVAGIVRIRLEVRETNIGAIRFYAGLGYQRLGTLKAYYSGQENAVRLESDLRKQQP
jgi:ribosomal-protein-alanine acetyltransferase